VDIATANRLRNLNRRIQQTYTNAAQVAALQNRQALQQIARYEPAPDLSAAENEAAARQHVQRVNRETGLIDRMAGEIAVCAADVGQDVAGVSQQTFAQCYRDETRNISGQAAALGIAYAASRYSQSELGAVFGGGLRPPGSGKPGFYEAVAQLMRDRHRGNYYFYRSLRRLGATSELANRLMYEFTQAAMRGESVQKLAARIRAVTDSKRYEAMRTARTECLRAANQSRYLAAKQAQHEHGLNLTKKWHHTSGQLHPRDMHEEIAGTVIPLDDYFVMSDGVQLLMPLDPNAPAYHTIHCGCNVTFGVVGLMAA